MKDKDERKRKDYHTKGEDDMFKLTQEPELIYEPLYRPVDTASNACTDSDNDDRSHYPRLDFSTLNISSTPISMEESLKDVIPIEWSDDVLSGKQKVIIHRIHRKRDE